MEFREESKKSNLLGERLIEDGVITPQQLELALKEQKRTGEMLGEILVGLGFISHETLSAALAAQSGVEFINLSRTVIEKEALSIVPEPFARQKKLIPISIEDNYLTVAMANIYDVEAISELERITKMFVKVVSSTETDITHAIDIYYTGGISIDELIEESIKLGIRYGTGAEASIAEEAPIIKLVDQLTLKGVKDEATDIHLEPEEKIFRIRYRIDGILSLGPSIPKALQQAINARLKIISGVNVAESRLPQDGRIKFQVGKKLIDIRVSFFPTIWGENVVLRLLDKSKIVMGLEQLGFDEKNLKIFKNIIERPNGIILVTGPTGSGKTTTLYSALSYLNSIEKNIITIEDPVEYEFPVIRQSQVNPKAGFTFAMGLRSILRQDPDIILIGEMRDKETIEMAIRAALTGHLVLSTLHTNDSVGAIPRLIDMGTEPFLISSSLIAVIAQRLVRLICDDCKISYIPPEDVLAKIESAYADNVVFYRGEGCEKCKGKGYRGRIGIFELLLVTEKIKKLIMNGADSIALKNAALEEGFITLFERGMELVKKGRITVEEVLRVSFGEA
ncbi:MAG: ATPase, T2SS/T4P/T4SS family [Acidobacteriota bacterium]